MQRRMGWFAIPVLLVACGGAGPTATQQSLAAPTPQAQDQLPDARATADFIIASAQQTAAAVREAPRPTQPAAPEPSPDATEVTLTAATKEVDPMPPTDGAEAGVNLRPGGFTVVEAQDYVATRIVGFVENRGAADAGSIEIVAEVVNASGKIVATGSSAYNRSVIPGGERSPFYILLERPRLPKYEKIVIHVQGEPVTPDALETFRRVEGLTIRNDSGQKPTDEYSGYTVFGRVINDAKEPVSRVQVLGIGYDRAGKPVSVGYTSTELDRIVPGGSSPFSLHLTDNPRQIVSYEVYAEGDVAR